MGGVQRCSTLRSKSFSLGTVGCPSQGKTKQASISKGPKLKNVKFREFFSVNLLMPQQHFSTTMSKSNSNAKMPVTCKLWTREFNHDLDNILIPV